MFKSVMVANTCLVLPLAVATMISPSLIFSRFGLNLNDAGILIARAYASSLVGYGLFTWHLRDIESRTMRWQVLTASFFFNICEFSLQYAARLQDMVNGLVWVTIALHALLCMATLSEMVLNIKIGKSWYV